MRLEAYNNNGNKEISRKIDEDLIHLPTKRYDPKNHVAVGVTDKLLNDVIDKNEYKALYNQIVKHINI